MATKRKAAPAAQPFRHPVNARAEALRGFDALPDDARIGVHVLAAIFDKSAEAVRADLRNGRVTIPESTSPNARTKQFRVGDVRAALRGKAAV